MALFAHTYLNVQDILHITRKHWQLNAWRGDRLRNNKTAVFAVSRYRNYLQTPRSTRPINFVIFCCRGTTLHISWLAEAKNSLVKRSWPGMTDEVSFTLIIGNSYPSRTIKTNAQKLRVSKVRRRWFGSWLKHNLSLWASQSFLLVLS